MPEYDQIAQAALDTVDHSMDLVDELHVPKNEDPWPHTAFNVAKHAKAVSKKLGQATNAVVDAVSKRGNTTGHVAEERNNGFDPQIFHDWFLMEPELDSPRTLWRFLMWFLVAFNCFFCAFWRFDNRWLRRVKMWVLQKEFFLLMGYLEVRR